MSALRIVGRLMCVSILMAALASTANAATITAFSSNFESGLTGVAAGDVSYSFGGCTDLQDTQGYSTYGFGSQFLFNGTYGNTTLTLSNLPDHTSIEIRYDLAIINSWDGSDTSHAFGPDYFNMSVDGTTVFRETIACYGSSNSRTFSPDPSQELVSAIVNLYTEGPGTSHEHTNDTGFHMPSADATTIPHTASTLEIAWLANGSGYQSYYEGGIMYDEAWAVDNVEIILHGVPEPATLTLLAMGGLAILRRRKV